MIRVKAKTVLLAGLVLSTGCAAKPAARPPVVGVTTSQDDPLVVPADFSVDLTVWARTPGTTGQPPAATNTRPGRFILFCDGSLHWSGRVDHPEDEMPPLRRVLRRGDMAALWTLIRQLGMDDMTNSTPLVNVHLVEPPAGEVLYLAVLTGEGQRWAIQRQAAAADRPDPAMASLVGRLTELAWGGAAEGGPGAPRRYDFGPDPYARYRR